MVGRLETQLTELEDVDVDVDIDVGMEPKLDAVAVVDDDMPEGAFEDEDRVDVD